ncbi:MAG: hypothetical protein DMF62_05310 [Acidobacteria bacterium]|nr:MAG: hypothetical protein DMF62_05310 [Acidobacteriota bacterium]
MKEIKVVPYSPEWRSMFTAESTRVAGGLGKHVIAVHHIGSTAIPGIFAKPVIDILVEVGEIAKVDQQKEAMEELGYEVMGEFGIIGRRYFRKDNDAGVRTHQIHVFETGTDQIRRHLAFRDFLIAHPKFANEYSDLKRRLANQFPDDPDAYMDGKDAFVKDIDGRAAKLRN